jgi:ribosomal protein S21
MHYVEVRDERDHKASKNSLDIAIKKLKKILKNDGMFQELKKREHYMSPSEKLKFKKNEAFKRRKREERKQEWHDKNKSSKLVGDNKWQQDIKE